MVALQSSEAPPTPPGYRTPYSLVYPKLGVTLGALALALVLIPLLGVIIWLLRGSITLSGRIDLGVALWCLLVGTITIIVHELIHGLVFRLLGYRVSFGVYWKLGFYTSALGQFQKRDHVIISAMAPLVLLSLVMLPLLAINNSLVSLAAFFVLLLNTSGASGDLYLTWRLSRMPVNTLVYDTDANHSYIYEPE